MPWKSTKHTVDDELSLTCLMFILHVLKIGELNLAFCVIIIFFKLKIFFVVLQHLGRPVNTLGTFL